MSIVVLKDAWMANNVEIAKISVKILKYPNLILVL